MAKKGDKPHSPLDNLRPFIKGQSGNPNGRPRGRLNRATIVMQWINTPLPASAGVHKGKTVLEVMGESMCQQAMMGNPKAFNALMDSAFGKVGADPADLAAAMTMMPAITITETVSTAAVKAKGKGKKGKPAAINKKTTTLSFDIGSAPRQGEQDDDEDDET